MDIACRKETWDNVFLWPLSVSKTHGHERITPLETGPQRLRSNVLACAVVVPARDRWPPTLSPRSMCHRPSLPPRCKCGVLSHEVPVDKDVVICTTYHGQWSEATAAGHERTGQTLRDTFALPEMLSYGRREGLTSPWEITKTNRSILSRIHSTFKVLPFFAPVLWR